MNNTSRPIITIEKELIEGLHFPEQEVLMVPALIAHRLSEAERAMKLGNNFNDKVKIMFEDSDGLKMVETTVWSFTDKRVILKRGMVIPLHRIHEIII
jgi:hypothetical protein